VTAGLLRHDGYSARVGPWRGDERSALIAPATRGRPGMAPGFLRWCCDQLASRGVARVVSPALLPDDTTAYQQAGFRTLEELHLLCHDLRSRPPARPSVARLRRGHRRDMPDVVRIDNDAFQPFWRFDANGLSEARSITPRSRFRVAAVGDTLAGYALTGFGQRQGYLQRLAVAPSWQRKGVGAAMVCDSLSWLARRRAERVMVNTQLANEPALGLYQSLGFHLEPTRLRVMAYDV